MTSMKAPIAPRTTILPNGLVLITEANTSRRSASMCWLVPGGVAYDPIENGDGFASLISEYLFRGAGSLDSRELSEAFDRLGARRSIVAETFFQRFSLTLAGENLYDGLSLMVDLVRTPHVAPDALEAVKSLCLQELNGLDDDPSHLSQLRLDEIRLPPPFDRHGLGTVATLQGATAEALRDHFTTSATPGGMILAASGAVDHDVLEAFLLNALDGMEGETTVPTPRGDVTGGSITLDRATSQSHLSMGFNAPIAADKDMIAFQLAAAILGGGASSRLFSVVREQQGLAYSIGGRYEGGRSIGAFTINAGTTPERMGTTLEAIKSVLDGFPESITDEEVTRIRTQVRSGALMQLEHGPARARRLAIDHFRRGSAQSMAEMLEAYDAVDSNEVREVATRWMDEAWRANRTQSLVGPVQP